MTPVVTALFAPASRPDRVRKALATAADAVVIDLEDAVAAGDRDAAREVVRAILVDVETPQRFYIRVNAHDSAEFAEDAALLGALAEAGCAPGAVILAKAENVAGPEAVASASGGASEVIALVETAAGLLAAPSLAAHPAVSRLAFGAADFTADIGGAGTPLALQFARQALVVASAAAGIEQPLDSPCFEIDDAEVVRAHGALGRELGFGGALAIHPRQLEPLAHGYAPDAPEVEWARRIVAAPEGGASRVDGQMVDAPILRRAQRILARAERSRG